MEAALVVGDGEAGPIANVLPSVADVVEESSLDILCGGPAQQLADDLEEMTRLYRLAASDLARARRDFPGDRVVSYLNRLVSSSYGMVYSTAGISWKDVGRWYLGGFPRLFNLNS